MAEFTETFTVQKVNTTDWATYRQFIESLRGKTQLIYRRTHNNYPVLHPEANPATADRWFDIVLRTSGNVQVRLRIRRSNLYLDGYQNANAQWLELGITGSDTQLICTSTFLGFRGDYNALENAAGQRREAIKLGWKELEDAVIKLASSTNRQERARALMVAIQMICESTRFKSILKQLATKFQDRSDDGTYYPDKAEVPPVWMMEQQTSWGHISEELLHIDSDPTHVFVPPNSKTNIKTATDAWEAIGMLKYFRFPRISGEQMDDLVAAEEYSSGVTN